MIALIVLAVIAAIAATETSYDPESLFDHQEQTIRIPSVS